MVEQRERRDSKRDKRSGPDKKGKSKFFKKKTCKFCSEKSGTVEYKDTERLVKFLTEKGKIIPRRISGNCAKHQRKMARAMKRSRHAAIIPFQTD